MAIVTPIETARRSADASVVQTRPRSRVSVLGTDIDRIEMHEVQQMASAAAAAGTQALIIAANPEKLMRLDQNATLRDCVHTADIVLPDGIGCVMAVRLLYGYRITRIPGADTMPALCAQAERDGDGIFLFGASPAVNEQLAARLQALFPLLHIAGRHHGHVDEDARAGMVDVINSSGAGYLFVALGTPKQEEWVQTFRQQLETPVIQCVGGTFDVLAGAVRRAPRAFQRVHLEWFFRLASNPRRWRRQLVLIGFIGRVLRERLASRQRRTAS